MAGEFVDELAQLWEEEGLFSRDIDGQLIRLVKATEQDYLRDVTLTIDGQEITVTKAEPTIDSQGNVVRDADGRTIPRDTTIYDAAQKLFVEQRGEDNPIPTLCHREHMHPVAVCRICCVEACRTDRDGNVVPGGTLVPACHQPVKPGMIIHTIASPDEARSQRVRNSVKVLTELLASDHLSPEGNGQTAGRTNELRELASQIQCNQHRFRFSDLPERGHDESSLLISVNHNACILCERCIRGCNEIKQNLVIGRTGKGYTSQIGFDLNNKMEQSTCVSCGECMVSCPTDALTFRRPIASHWHQQLVAQPGYSAVSPEELKQHPLFRGVSYKWLQWNQASVVRRRVKKGDVLGWLGEYGATAFLLNQGEFALWFREPSVSQERRNSGGWWQQLTRGIRGRARSQPERQSAPRQIPSSPPDAINTPEDIILGEMTCLSFHPRTATVVAWSDGEIYEIRRNVLYMLQQNALARRQLDKVYRERALMNHMRHVALFAKLDEHERGEAVEYLRDKVQLVSVEPGQTIFRQGEQSNDFYMVRLGFVKVSQTYLGQPRIRTYLGPNSYFGEIGLLSASEDLRELEVPEGMDGKRTSSCAALDDVELVRIRGEHFRELVLRYQKLREELQSLSRQRLASDQEMKADDTCDDQLEEFLEQGLFNGQKLLVLDLDSCTRCEECVKACADTHGGVTRLVREGLRFDKFLVASACRSCRDPYCMVGCPVDAIHRQSSLEVVIDDHCIGCGLCARNCPYGNINMVGEPDQDEDPETGQFKAVIRQRATTCDLCKSVGVDASHPQDEVSCVYACPHNAAFRLDGSQLLAQIRSTKKR